MQRQHHHVLRVGTRLVLAGLFSALWVLLHRPQWRILFVTLKIGWIMVPASFFFVLACRYRRGGCAEVRREVQTVTRHLVLDPWRFAVTSVTITDTTQQPQSVNDWLCEFFLLQAVVSKYLLSYGPFSFAGTLLFPAGFGLVLQPMVLWTDWFFSSWWLPFLFAILVVTSMWGTGIAANTACHRYFSHNSFQTTRCGTFLLGVLGCCGGQNGGLWWSTNQSSATPRVL